MKKQDILKYIKDKQGEAEVFYLNKKTLKKTMIAYEGGVNLIIQGDKFNFKDYACKTQYNLPCEKDFFEADISVGFCLYNIKNSIYVNHFFTSDYCENPKGNISVAFHFKKIKKENN